MKLALRTGGVLVCLLGALASAAPAQAAPTHAEWTAALHKYVRAGKVDYRGLKEHGALLDTYLRTLLGVKKEELAALDRAEQLAFWINAYNAYAVRLILDHFPVDSIRSIGLFPGAAFRRKFIPLAGEQLSLNDVEDRLRALNEPRIHFAIVCASKSCPELKGEAYTAGRLDKDLEEATRAFLRDPEKNRFDEEARTFHLSSIFKWYRGDFERAAGSLEEYLARNAPGGAALALRKGGVRLDFLGYDWSLNGQ
ncbi:MAG: DUF547 domain-containing protein [Myxococcales bacterium]